MIKRGGGMYHSRFFPVLICLVLLMVIPGGNTNAATLSLVINNPVCVQPSLDTGICYIKSLGVTVTGSEASFSQLQVFVDNKLRINMQGFFEANASLTPNMLGNGLAVACGGPNASGLPGYGKTYALYVTASMLDGTNTWGSTQVRCPYYDGKNFVPTIQKP